MISIELEEVANSFVGLVPVTEVLAATLKFAEPKNQLMSTDAQAFGGVGVFQLNPPPCCDGSLLPI